MAESRRRKWVPAGDNAAALARRSAHLLLFDALSRRMQRAPRCAARGGPQMPKDATAKPTVGIAPRTKGGFGRQVGLALSPPGLSRAAAEALHVPVFGPDPNATGKKR
jgi:hypothetical protein